jgi:hypothetical protein
MAESGLFPELPRDFNVFNNRVNVSHVTAPLGPELTHTCCITVSKVDLMAATCLEALVADV